MIGFRAFPFWFHPTIRATIDRRVVMTIPCALDLARHTEIPAWLLETGEYAVIDPPKDARWETVGTSGLYIGNRKWQELGIHIPEAVKLEIAEWCEKWVRAHPDIQCLARTEVAYQRNNYQTTKTVLFTYNQLRQYHESRENDRRGLPGAQGAANAAPSTGHELRRGTAPGAGRAQARRQGARAQNVAVDAGAYAHTLFDQDGGEDRD